MPDETLHSVLPREEAAEQFLLLAEKTDIYAIFLLDLQGAIATWNDGARRMKGYEAEEAVGRFFGFLYTDDEQAAGKPADHLERARTHGLYEGEFWRKRKDGSLFWAHVVLTALVDHQGRLRGFAKITQDLSSRKELEDRLRERQQETERILEAADAGTWKLDLLRHRVSVSEHFVRLLGYETLNVSDSVEDWVAFTHPDDRERVTQAFDQVMLQRPSQPLSFDIRLRCADGSYRWFYSRADWYKVEGEDPHVLLGVCVDAHELRQAQEERMQLFHDLEMQRTRFRAILEQLPSGIAVADVPSGKLIYQNAESEHVLGKTLANAEHDGNYLRFGAMSADGRELTPEDMPLIRAVRFGEVVKAEEILFRRVDGSIATLSVNAAPIREEDGSTRLAVAVFNDILPLKEAQASLAAERERAQITLTALSDGVITTDVYGRVEYLNPAAERLTGWALAEAKGRPIQSVFDFVDEHDGQPLTGATLSELDGESPIATKRHGVLTAKGGKQYVLDNAMAPIHLQNGKLIGAVLVLHDVTESRTLLHTLAYQASHDALTGLVNRREFETRLQRVFENTRANHVSGALLYMDLDQFKIVNDTCGHSAGDELLRQLAHAYQAQVRDRDTFARLGGDEFAVLLEHVDTEGALQVANKLLEATRRFCFETGNRAFKVGVSIGVVPIDDKAESFEQILKMADHACYIAKEGGRNRIYLQQTGDVDVARRQSDMQWATRLGEALHNDQLHLFYQPIVPIGHPDKRRHYEILLRLQDGAGGFIAPDNFLPAAERYDIMPAVDRWVLKNSLDWLKRHPRHVDELELCTINLSRRSVADDGFHQFAIETIEQAGIPMHKLCFEITENGAIANPPKTLQFIDALKSKGCRFSLDDFGTGMASFAYLKMLPVDFIKIDGSFVRMMADSPVDYEMVRFTNEISHIMGRQTIAEYVTDQSILDKLQSLQVDFAQGSWVSDAKPLSDGVH